MKTTTLFTFLALLLGFTASAQRMDEGVCLFDGRNFSGEHLTITDDWSQSCPTGFSIESIMIPEGYEVWAYTGSNYSNDYMVLTSDWNGYSPDAWRWCNRISSVKIVRRPFRRCGTPDPPMHEPTLVRVFQHSNFEGESIEINSDWSVRNWDDYWNDKISSISITPGIEVTVYEHANFQGRSVTLTSDWTVYAWNDFWNDRISSIQVRYAPRMGYNGY